MSLLSYFSKKIGHLGTRLGKSLDRVWRNVFYFTNFIGDVVRLILDWKWPSSKPYCIFFGCSFFSKSKSTSILQLMIGMLETLVTSRIFCSYIVSAVDWFICQIGYEMASRVYSSWLNECVAWHNTVTWYKMGMHVVMFVFISQNPIWLGKYIIVLFFCFCLSGKYHTYPHWLGRGSTQLLV